MEYNRFKRKNCYQALGLEHGCLNTERINSAFRAASRDWHPDNIADNIIKHWRTKGFQWLNAKHTEAVEKCARLI